MIDFVIINGHFHLLCRTLYCLAYSSSFQSLYLAETNERYFERPQFILHRRQTQPTYYIEFYMSNKLYYLRKDLEKGLIYLW